jgi:3-phenylpropionate/cinnamic acid dioxygenase small subunit
MVADGVDDEYAKAIITMLSKEVAVVREEASARKTDHSGLLEIYNDMRGTLESQIARLRADNRRLQAELEQYKR